MVSWQKWRRAFEFFVVGKGIENVAQKSALLLHSGGMKMQDIYLTFPTAFEPDRGETVYGIAMKQLDNYFRPKVNTIQKAWVSLNDTRTDRECVSVFDLIKTDSATL